MDISVERGGDKDLPELLDLIKELASFEDDVASVTNSLEQMKSERASFEFLVARSQDQVVAMAVYFFAYFTFVGKALYLDDIYVKPEYRGNGIATQMMTELFEIAKNEKCKRVSWQVLEWNEPAKALYSKMGASFRGDWINCDFYEPTITELANRR